MVFAPALISVLVVEADACACKAAAWAAVMPWAVVPYPGIYVPAGTVVRVDVVADGFINIYNRRTPPPTSRMVVVVDIAPIPFLRFAIRRNFFCYAIFVSC